MAESAHPPLRFLCFGVGAIGTYIGGSLALAGYPVVFIERTEIAAGVHQRGLSLVLKDGPHQVPAPQVVDSVAAALERGPFDAAILAVKAFDTASVLDSIRPYAAAMPPILSFQNGVENEPLLATGLGADRVIPGTVTTAVGRKGAGDIVVERLRGIGVSTAHPLGPVLIAALDRAGLRAHAFPNPAAMKWSKLLTNLMANASSAILDMTPAQIFSDPRLFQMETRMLRETLQVMQAQNIPVVDLPSTPVRALAWIVSTLPPTLSRPLLLRSVGAGRGAKMPSFHIDLYAGRGKSEVDYLNGAVVRCGERYQIATPVNRTLNDVLQGLTRGDIPRETYAHKPELLLAQIPAD